MAKMMTRRELDKIAEIQQKAALWMKIFRESWIASHHSIAQTISGEGQIVSLIKEVEYQGTLAIEIE